MKANNYKYFDLKKLLIINYTLLIVFSSCSVSKQISNSAEKTLINDSVISTGHIGISIYEPATNKYWYNYDATKYFVPASNIKLFTLYAGMKYLGDSLVGLRYSIENGDTTIYPTGDPTFLYKDFATQPVFDFLKRSGSHLFYARHFFKNNDLGLGVGWAWDDYKESYMRHKSKFPIYGNLFTIPFIPTDSVVLKMLNDTLGEVIKFEPCTLCKPINLQAIYSRPIDSLFKPMMYNSDNFFAEQTLLMISNQQLNHLNNFSEMNDEDIIDTLLRGDLNDAPQKPKWVDGSGLSRYNLFTPQDFVYILNKMKNEFGLKRLEVILPTGNEGTLKNYYLKDSGFIYVKTGSMSNNSSLSGFIITKKNKLLLFSILVNNFQGSGTPVKKAVEQFLENIREKY
jgi:D-alanyl-D-alanine carboxypeptidase/D-alanyl-D-alanine-endopeptidase (penicillin-binding protein 4)